MFVTLFNYKFDGLLTRTSKAWLTHDDGSIAAVAAGVRRVIERGALSAPWVYIEGARTNVLDDPTDLTAAGWDTPAPSSTTVEAPTGDITAIAVIDNDGTTVRQVFDSPGSARPAVTASVYVKSASTSVFGVQVTGSSPSGSSPMLVVPTAWRRVWRSTVPAASSHAIEMVPSIDGNLVWGACLETVGAYAAPANFPSQPILEKTTRTAETFSVGGITAEIASMARSFRVDFVPDFGSADVLNGQVFNVVQFAVGLTSVGIWLEGTGSGQVRARGGNPGAFVSSGPLTFLSGRRLTLSFTPSSGVLEVFGPLSGGGVFTLGTYSLAASTLFVGSAAAGGGEAFGLVSPVEIGFDDFFLDGIDQVTSNSIRVSFADGNGVPVDVRQFSELSAVDALNPSNYLVSGSPGLPLIQYVQPGAVGSEVVLFFDARLAPGAEVKIRARNLVRAGVVPVPVYDGQRAAIECIEQGPGNYTGRVEVVEPGVAGQGAIFELANWTGPGSPPGLFGVEVVDPSPAAPHIRYNFTFGEPSFQMEAAVNFVAGSLMRIVIPGDPIQLTDEDGWTYVFDSASAEDPITLGLLAFGAEVNSAAIVVDADVGRVDVANPQTEVDAAQGASLGTFQVTETGDLANEHGRSYLRKRIFRRLSTFRAGFFHLAGYGLRFPSKNLFTSTTIRRLQLDIETQVRQEPGVTAVRASIAELTPGIVKVTLRVQDDNGSFGLEATLDFTAG